MASFDSWRFHSDFSIRNAAFLIAGSDPQDFETYADDRISVKARGYSVIRDALVNGVITDRIETTKTSYDTFDFDTPSEVCINRTLISRSELDRWVRSCGRYCEVFALGVDLNMQLESDSPFTSVKLNAANRAWLAVTSDPTLLRGKSPKQALEAWLIENAADLGLVKRDGTPNRNGIEEICKVANWKPEGGATPTPASDTGPSRALTPTPPVQRLAPPRGPKETFDIDDECPF